MMKTPRHPCMSKGSENSNFTSPNTLDSLLILYNLRLNNLHTLTTNPRLWPCSWSLKYVLTVSVSITVPADFINLEPQVRDTRNNSYFQPFCANLYANLPSVLWSIKLHMASGWSKKTKIMLVTLTRQPERNFFILSSSFFVVPFYIRGEE